MALTKVGPAGIGSTPGTGYVIGDSFLHSTGLNATNAYYTGIVTSQSIRVLGDLQVDGTTTTLDTEVTSVDKLEVEANNTTVGVAITQSGSGDILNLYDGSNEVFSVADGGTVTASGDISIADKIIHTGDTNTAIRFPADDTVTVETGGNEKLRITSAGNVGIGTDNPSAKLHVNGTIRSRGPATPNINLSPLSGEVGNADISFDGDDLRIVSNSSGADVRINAVSRNNDFVLKSSGNIGIGTDNPNQELHIHASGTSYLQFTDESSGTGSTNGAIFGLDNPHLYAWNYQAGDFVVATNATEKLRIESDGDVRIGSSSDYGWIRGWNSSTGDMIISADHSATGSNGSNLIFRSRGSEKLRIFSDGNVRIGDNSISVATVGSGPTLAINGTAPEITLRDDASGNPYAVMRTNDYGSLYLEADQGNAAANSTIHFIVDNAERMRIDSSGNVGVGTETVDFAQFGSNTGGVAIQDVGGTNTGLKIGEGSNSNYMVAAGNGNLYQSHYGTGSMIFGVGSSGEERMRIDSAGRIAIGVNATSYPFRIFNNTSNFVQFSKTGDSVAGSLIGRVNVTDELRVQNSENAPISLLTNNLERVRITGSGNVGIGLIQPQKILDVLSNSDDFVSVGSRTLSINQWTGIHFGYREDNTAYRKSAIVFERVDGSARGNVHILNNGAGTNASATLSDAKLTILSDGKVSVGGVTPVRNFNVYSGSSTTARIHATGTGSYAQLEFLHDSDSSTWIWKNGSTQSGHAGVHSWNFYNPHNSAIAFYTNTTEKVRISGDGKLGVGVVPTDVLHVQTSNTTGAFRLGGNNSGHRIYINSSPTGSYLDSYGSNSYDPFRIDCSTLSLNGSSGGGVNINRTGTAYAQLDLRQSTGHPAFNIGFPDGSFYRNLGTVGPASSDGSTGQYLHIRLRTIWNNASMTMFRLTGYYSYSAYTESYVGMYRYSNSGYRYTPYGQIISNQSRATVTNIYNTNADPGYLVIVCDWNTGYTGLMIEHCGAGGVYASYMQQDLEIIDTKRSTGTSAQW